MVAFLMGGVLMGGVLMGGVLMGGVLLGDVLMKLRVDGWWVMGGDGYLIRVEGLLGRSIYGGEGCGWFLPFPRSLPPCRPLPSTLTISLCDHPMLPHLSNSMKTA